MGIFRYLMIGAFAVGLSGCDSKIRHYEGPAVTSVVVKKQQRKMYLLHRGKVLRQYDIGLGFAPEGHKEQRGDGRTPEGVYKIDRRNPDSRFHLSLGISYPNAQDVARAQTMGVHPGGDIFIHGRPKAYQDGKRDWTWGCIGVTNDEIEDIYSMVRDGTPVKIVR